MNYKLFNIDSIPDGDPLTGFDFVPPVKISFLSEPGTIRDVDFGSTLEIELLNFAEGAFSVDVTSVAFPEYSFSVSDLSIQFDASSQPVLDLEDFAETSFVFVGKTGEIRDLPLSPSAIEQPLQDFIVLDNAFSVTLTPLEFPEYTFDGVGSPDVFLDLTTIENASLGVFSEDGDTLTTFEFNDIGGAFSVTLTSLEFPEYP
ncbi:hypothetical protein [Hyella patelloides]|nr:hypothetical protein [Hyella patelloides]